MSLLLYFLLVYCVTISKDIYIKLLFVLHIDYAYKFVTFFSFYSVPFIVCLRSLRSLYRYRRSTDIHNRTSI